MSRHAELLGQFFKALERLDLGAVAGFCSAHCVYEDVPYPEATVVGPAAIRAKLELGFAGLERLATKQDQRKRQADYVGQDDAPDNAPQCEIFSCRNADDQRDYAGGTIGDEHGAGRFHGAQDDGSAHARRPDDGF
jgi:hypothetical protein